MVKGNSPLMRSDVYAILKLSFPMMLVSLSNSLMGTIDKMMLSKIDVDLMSMVLIANYVVMIPFYGVLSLAGISEVFIGQLNGAKRYSEIPKPMWQMVIFSLLLFAITIPLGLWGGPCLLSVCVCNAAEEYYKILMIFVPLAGVMGAFSSFYVGIGKTNYVIVCVLVGNIFGIFIDYLFINGISIMDGAITIPAMHATGAAIGTIFGEVVIIIMLFLGISQKKYRLTYHTLKFSTDFKMLWSQIKIGFPNSLSHSGEMLAWTLMLSLISKFKPDILPEITIPCALFGFLIFTTDGLQRGVIAIASNLIGAQSLKKFKELNISIIKASCILMVFVSLPLLAFPSVIANLYNVNAPSEGLLLAIRMVGLYLIVDIPMWQLVGLLTSGGDTRFIMITNLFSSWLLCVLPVYVGLKFGMFESGAHLWLIFMVYVAVNIFVYFMRYTRGPWRHNIFTSSS